jgi:hypothetical protein
MLHHFEKEKKHAQLGMEKWVWMGFYSTQCYVDGKKVDLVVTGGSKKKTRKGRTSKKGKIG